MALGAIGLGQRQVRRRLGVRLAERQVRRRLGVRLAERQVRAGIVPRRLIEWWIEVSDVLKHGE
jgi:hypothetical protein